MSILFNYPRRLPGVDKLRRKFNGLKKRKNQELFIKWLEAKLPLYAIHHGNSKHIVTAEFLTAIKNGFYKKRPSVEYHEKSKAFRIARNHAHGGTPWRSECFETEAEALSFIEQNDLISDF